MAFDYKTVQAMAASQPRDAHGYCPECGRPWRDPSPERPHPAMAVPWHPVFLAVVGLALAITFGARAARAYRLEAATRGDLASLTTCVGRGSAAPSCPSMDDQEDWLRVDYANEATARGQRDRALVATALGLLALGIGLRRLARRRWPDRPASALATFGRWGESLLALTCLQVLALTLASLAVQLARGLPFAWERLDAAADGVLVVVSLLTGSPF
jgi:hypothetical protein